MRPEFLRQLDRRGWLVLAGVLFALVAIRFLLWTHEGGFVQSSQPGHLFARLRLKIAGGRWSGLAAGETRL